MSEPKRCLKCRRILGRGERFHDHCSKCRTLPGPAGEPVRRFVRKKRSV